jgi:tRNA(Ile)-lysidine synthase
MPSLSPLARRVKEFCRRNGLLDGGNGVLVGFSGGPDSVALLLLLEEISRNGAPPLRLAAAHLNHGLRGGDAETDADFCRDLTRSRDIDFAEGTVEVRRERRPGESIEEAARRLRYAFLTDAAAEREIERVAVGHHADDQAETVLMRLSRGCGLNGLEAIPPCRPSARRPAISIIRPLLSLRKVELRGYLQERGQRFRTDASNRDTAFRRNRIRHVLLPHLARACGEDLTARLCGVARTAGEVNDELRLILRTAWPDLCTQTDTDGVVLGAEELAHLPKELRKWAIRRALAGISPADKAAPDLARSHLEDATDLLERAVGTELSLPGSFAARREHGGIYLHRTDANTPLQDAPLPIPAVVDLPAARVRIGTEFCCLPDGGMPELLGKVTLHNVYLSAAALDLPLTVRPRRPGDRFHPLGAPGAKKLKDFLIDRKVPHHRRDLIPLVVDASGRVAWVGGHEISDAFKLVGNERTALHLWLEPLATDA